MSVLLLLMMMGPAASAELAVALQHHSFGIAAAAPACTLPMGEAAAGRLAGCQGRLCRSPLRWILELARAPAVMLLILKSQLLLFMRFLQHTAHMACTLQMSAGAVAGLPCCCHSSQPHCPLARELTTNALHHTSAASSALMQ